MPIHERATQRVESGENVPSPLSRASIVSLLTIGGEREEEATRTTLRGMNPHERGPHALFGAINRLRSIQRSLSNEQIQELESLAKELVIKEFSIPSSVKINAHLVQRMPGFHKNTAPVEIADSPEVHKRRTINAIMQGGASAFQYLFLMEQPRIEEIAPGLTARSRELMAVADQGVWLVDERNFDITNLPAGGVVKLSFEGGKITINAHATEYPLLLHELAKGALEALALHGLPKDTRLRAQVLRDSDKAHYEGWDLRIGKGLWRVLNGELPKEPSQRSRALKAIFELPAEEFNRAIEELINHNPELIRVTVEKVLGIT